MALNDREKLAIFVIIYFSLALPAAIVVCKKQGISRGTGWFYLLTLPVFRIAGSACLIAAYQESHPQTGLLAAAGIFNSLGLISLELTLLGLVERANAGLEKPFHYAVRGLRICHFMLFVAGGISISGGVEITSSNHGTVVTGQSLRKAAGLLLLSVWLILVLTTVGILARKHQAWVGDRNILYAAAASFPFLLVREVYTLITCFDTSSKTFNVYQPNVYVEAFMQILMECIVVALFIAAGLSVPSVGRAPPEDAKEGDPPGISQTNSADAPRIAPGNDVELGTLPSRPQQ